MDEGASHHCYVPALALSNALGFLETPEQPLFSAATTLQPHYYITTHTNVSLQTNL